LLLHQQQQLSVLLMQASLLLPNAQPNQVQQLAQRLQQQQVARPVLPQAADFGCYCSRSCPSCCCAKEACNCTHLQTCSCSNSSEELYAELEVSSWWYC
jgi:hypothetical protein